MALGAANIHAVPVPPPGSTTAAPAAPSSLPLAPGPGAHATPPPHFHEPAPLSPGDAVGRLVCVQWPADGRWYQGEVLAFGAAQRPAYAAAPADGSPVDAHHVLFADGEDEWLDLREEAIAWGPAETARPQGALGALSGGPPVGDAARGWRVSLLCPASGRMLDALVTSYDARSGLHGVEYDDGTDAQVDVERAKVGRIRVMASVGTGRCVCVLGGQLLRVGQSFGGVGARHGLGCGGKKL